MLTWDAKHLSLLRSKTKSPLQLTKEADRKRRRTCIQRLDLLSILKFTAVDRVSLKVQGGLIM